MDTDPPGGSIVTVNLVTIQVDVADAGGNRPSKGSVNIAPSSGVVIPGTLAMMANPQAADFNSSTADPRVFVIPPDAPGMPMPRMAYRMSFPGIDGLGNSFIMPLGNPGAFTNTNGSPSVFTWSPNSDFIAAGLNVFPNGTGLTLQGTPGTLNTNQIYYVVNSSGSTFQLAAVPDGAALASTAGSGTLVVASYRYSSLAPATIPDPSIVAGSPAAVRASLGLGTAALSDASAFLATTGGDVLGPFRTQIPNIVFDGDSLTIGAGVQPFNVFPRGGDYPSQVVSALDPRGTYYNVGVGGEQISTMITNAPTVVDAKLVAGRNNIVVICGGSNDIWVSDINPYSRIVTYCQARRAAGWKVIVGTITPRADTQDTLPADFETVRLACNTSIRANWQTFADGIADWGGDSVIGVNQVAALNATHYTGDGAHHNWRGYAVRARYALQALSTLGVIGQYKEQAPAGIYDAWKPAQDFYAVSGAPTFGIMPGTYHQSWKMDHGSDMEIAADFLPPVDWVGAGCAVAYTRTGSATGTVALQNAYASQINIYSMDLAKMPDVARGGQTPPGGHLVARNYLGQSFLGGSPPPAAGKVYSSPMFSLIGNNGNTPRCAQKIIIKRTGTDATYDTCTDSIYVLGVYLFKNA